MTTDEVNFDEIYNKFVEERSVQDNFDMFVSVSKYTPDIDKDKTETQVFWGYFPYVHLFPVKEAHTFPKFMLRTTGEIKDEDGKVFVAPKGYLIFDIVYIYYRLKKKNLAKWKRYYVYNP